MNNFNPLRLNPQWACWCIPATGLRIHDTWEQACPDCGRLQPPKNITKLGAQTVSRPKDMK